MRDVQDAHARAPPVVRLLQSLAQPRDYALLSEMISTRWFPTVWKDFNLISENSQSSYIRISSPLAQRFLSSWPPFSCQPPRSLKRNAERKFRKKNEYVDKGKFTGSGKSSAHFLSSSSLFSLQNTNVISPKWTYIGIPHRYETFQFISRKDLWIRLRDIRRKWLLRISASSIYLRLFRREITYSPRASI